MRIDRVKVDGFKNLNQFEIDLNGTQMNTILLGQNAAGKSNFLEALVIIFRDLDLFEKKSSFPEFNFEISYKCKSNQIRIVGVAKEDDNPLLIGDVSDREKPGYSFFVDDERKSKAAFYKDKDEHLPKYVISYYSGVSNRLVEHFDIHQKRFYDDLLAGKDDPMRPLFYARLIHSHFVLMAFYSFHNDVVKTFLEEYLNISGLESILFVLKRPEWAKVKKGEGADSSFWKSRGVVKNFLDDLWEASMAPISHKDNVREDFNKHPEKELLYIYISNQEKLEKLAAKYVTNTNFFKMLESTYISDLIQEVRVKVKKIHSQNDVTFKELSEGEQQLLTVLGLLRFTNEAESLILLDEPDTHLNPVWKWNYMTLLDKIVEKNETSQIIMTTHDPLVIGGLTKEEIRIFYTEGEQKQIRAIEPEFDPRGLGVAGILTSDFFGLPSTLDKETLKLLTRRNELLVQQDSQELALAEKVELNELFQTLSQLGINTTDRDPLYEKFLIAMGKANELTIEKLSGEQLEKQNEVAAQIMKELLKEDQGK
ncbi:MAG: AAA family ATPase [Mucilaginibacter sp.]|uniref:AAA family ATPase n=1 Tax=Mucilaginibacter sp. TaxID=1882438 RepID=UPI00326690D8